MTTDDVKRVIDQELERRRSYIDEAGQHLRSLEVKVEFDQRTGEIVGVLFSPHEARRLTTNASRA